MDNVALNQLVQMKKSRSRRKLWHHVLRVMAMVVVFCTTYALILPAITMEHDTVCGLEAHEHTQECYSSEAPCVFICQESFENKTVIHAHDALCYDGSDSLICPLNAISVHTHGESCFEITNSWQCGQDETAAHTHDISCYTLTENTLCGLEEVEAHTHDSSCLAPEPILICTQEEKEAHTHTEDCYHTVTETVVHTHSDSCFQEDSQLICTVTEDSVTRQELICPLEESSGHSHFEDCYQNLICGLTEDPGHIHTDSCKLQLTCTLEETTGHSHTESCACTTEKLICELSEIELHTHGTDCGGSCDKPEVIAHVHTSECLQTDAPQSPLLLCEKEEHTHDESCYPEETPLPTDERYLCGLGIHTHGEHCTNEDGTIECNIPEHVHNIQCVMENYDPIADVETSAQWEASFASVVLTGHHPTDVIAIAKTQLGYSESATNCYLFEDGNIRGYSRYGAWYGYSYGDWCAMFASFCLHYAGVNNFPLDAACGPWAAKLQQLERYHFREDYTPKPGDLIFFDWERASGYDVVLDHVGLVAEVPGDGTIITIEGNSGDRVQYCTYSSDDIRIVGYGEIPEGKIPSEPIQKVHQGPDYTVTLTYDESANIPQAAEVVVREIPQGSEEYAMYYFQSVQAVQDSQQSGSVEIAFARFFDISFVYDGQIIEPETPVEVTITYQNSLEITQDEESKAVHFADSGIEVLEVETNTSENQADTFTFTQNSFSVSGTLVTAVSANARSIDLSNAENLANCISSVKFLNSSGAESTAFVNGDSVTIVLEGTIWSWQFSSSGGTDKVFKLTPGENLALSAYACTGTDATATIDTQTNTFGISIPAVPGQYGQYADVRFQIHLTATAINQTQSPVTATVQYTSCKIYSGRQEFTTTLSDGTVVYLDMPGGNISPENYQVMIEPIDRTPYWSSMESYTRNQFTADHRTRELEDAVVFKAYLQSKTNPNEIVNIPAPYNLSVTFAQSPLTVSPIGTAAVVNLTNGNASKPAGGSAALNENAVTSVSISDTNNVLDQFGIMALSGMIPTSSNLSLKYNKVTDAFLRDEAYAEYYNANSPLGTAGSFHIVAFDTANLNTHTNGNILAKNLNARSNFGTNGFEKELTYVQNYLKINSVSASSTEHILAIGSSNTLDLYDNGNRFSVNGTALDKPKNMIQDVDTASAPFIDLNRVRTEIQQLSTNLAGYDNMYLNISYDSQYNRISLSDPDDVGILNVTPSSPEVFGKHTIYLDGFQTGHNGSIVINVDCTGASTIRLPVALVVIDGETQGTAEVVEFSNGKVLWNFINASGVTIETERMTGMIIAPGATVNINQNLNGTVVADVVNVNAESHRTDFTGKILPQTEGEEEVGRSVTIQKIKSGYVGTTLADAHFDLHIWNGTDWEKVNLSSIITNSEGLFRLEDLEEDVAYRLVETKAPSGYILASKPFYFWIRPTTKATAPAVKPQGFSGTAVDSGGVLNIANEPDEKVDTTQLSIQKQWSYSTLQVPTRISVDIYQITMKGDLLTDRTLFKTVTLTQVLNWEVTVTDLPLNGIDAYGSDVTYLYTVEEKTIPGFSASYSENNTPGVTEGTIVITNTESGDGYTLPETGGIGTHHYTFGGLLILSALMYALTLKYKRRKEENP